MIVCCCKTDMNSFFIFNVLMAIPTVIRIPAVFPASDPEDRRGLHHRYLPETPDPGLYPGGFPANPVCPSWYKTARFFIGARSGKGGHARRSDAPRSRTACTPPVSGSVPAISTPALSGAVMTSGPQSGQIRGPVQLAFARSLDRFFPSRVTVARSSLLHMSEDSPPWSRRRAIAYGLYEARGFLSANLARETGFFRGRSGPPV